MVPLIGNLVPVVALRALGACPVCAGTALLRESVRRTGIGNPVRDIIFGVQIQNSDVASKKAESLNHVPLYESQTKREEKNFASA